MFKVGDWVIRGNDQGIDSNGKNANRLIFKITEFGILDDEELAVFNRHSAPLNELNKWQPKEGEWCWFYRSGIIPAIAKYSITEHGKHIGYFHYHDLNTDGSVNVPTLIYSDYIEPFIGELPSFIKEK